MTDRGCSLNADVRRFRVALILFVSGLVVSGVTAFPLLQEVELLAAWLGADEPSAGGGSRGLTQWIAYVREGLRETYSRYPFVGYGTDWLAFGHLAIAVFFLGPIVQPRRDHAWILISGMIACVGVIPLALVCGEIRGIPMGWRLIDCAFGVIGIVPLAYAYRVGRRIRAAAGGNRRSYLNSRLSHACAASGSEQTRKTSCHEPAAV